MKIEISYDDGRVETLERTAIKTLDGWRFEPAVHIEGRCSVRFLGLPMEVNATLYQTSEIDGILSPFGSLADDLATPVRNDGPAERPSEHGIVVSRGGFEPPTN